MVHNDLFSLKKDMMDAFSANSTVIMSAVASDLKNSLSDFETNFSREIISCLSDFSQILSHDISVKSQIKF